MALGLTLQCAELLSPWTQHLAVSNNCNPMYPRGTQGYTIQPTIPSTMKQRNLLKGRVKRLLKDQKDMGQVSESAVFACSSAVQVFVKDIASKMQKEAVEGIGLTPIELKKSILASTELRFLHEKVTAIDESDAKYHKPARGSKKRALTPTAKKSTAKKPRTKKTEKVARTTSSTAKKTERISDGRIRSDAAAVTVKPVSLISNARALNVEEDDDYDESESDS